MNVLAAALWNISLQSCFRIFSGEEKTVPHGSVHSSSNLHVYPTKPQYHYCLRLALKESVPKQSLCIERHMSLCLEKEMNESNNAKDVVFL